MMKLYRMLTFFTADFIELWLRWRLLRGKENKARFRERFGYTKIARPAGLLLWIHAASVGEANSVLALIARLRERFPDMGLLITTGTVTSAALMQKRLPPGAIHQYVPVDTPQATMRFIRHWKPDIALWVESELWPNLIHAARIYYCFMGIINGRMSERSFARWQKFPRFARELLSGFSIVFAQSEKDGERFEKLGVKKRAIAYAGNLKYDGMPLPYLESDLLQMTDAIAGRPHFLAASTHPGEEDIIAQAHEILSVTRSDLLTFIIPRHPSRGKHIAQSLKAHGTVALRSKGDKITPHTQFYIADTLGELGLFYRLNDVVFMGGSLVEHGGQNPLEPARLSCAIVTGPHTRNFADIYQEMETVGGILRVQNATQLAAQIDTLLNDGHKRAGMQSITRAWISGKSGSVEKILDTLAPVFEATPL